MDEKNAHVPISDGTAVDTARHSMTLHARCCVDSVTEETIARHLHTHHSSYNRTRVYPYANLHIVKETVPRHFACNCKAQEGESIKLQLPWLPVEAGPWPVMSPDRKLSPCPQQRQRLAAHARSSLPVRHTPPCKHHLSSLPVIQGQGHNQTCSALVLIGTKAKLSSSYNSCKVVTQKCHSPRCGC